MRMALSPSPTGAERAAALSRMVAALEAAKKARDSGQNVQQVRGMLKAARSAFEKGDYETAARFADQVLETCRDQSVDRKSTRLNSSHLVISYAVFCLKKK